MKLRKRNSIEENTVKAHACYCNNACWCSCSSFDIAKATYINTQKDQFLDSRFMGDN